MAGALVALHNLSDQPAEVTLEVPADTRPRQLLGEQRSRLDTREAQMCVRLEGYGYCWLRPEGADRTA